MSDRGIGGGWPGPQLPQVIPAASGGNDRDFEAAKKPPKRRRLWWVISLIVVALAAGIPAHIVGAKNAVRDYKAQVAASASAEAATHPPADLYCPLPGSAEARTAIGDQPVVVVDRPPAQRVVVMRKAVVVVVRAVLVGDLVVCGNDARIVLEVSPRPSARILVQGGTDTKTKGAGPMVFLVDHATLNGQRVWFSNRHPQVVPCRGDRTPATSAALRPCASYYSTAAPTPTPGRSR